MDVGTSVSSKTAPTFFDSHGRNGHDAFNFVRLHGSNYHGVSGVGDPSLLEFGLRNARLPVAKARNDCLGTLKVREQVFIVIPILNGNDLDTLSIVIGKLVRLFTSAFPISQLQSFGMLRQDFPTPASRAACTA